MNKSIPTILQAAHFPVMGLCCLLLFSVGGSVLAQATRFYSTEQGLSNSLINEVYQDRKGFIWIATENGLNKFDGTQFLVYKKNKRDTTSLKSNHVKTKPDLIISDILMPKMDGITLCRKIKANINTAHIPVILLTAKSTEEDLLEGLDIGADAYIVKPFNPQILKKTVTNLITNRERLKDKSQTQTEGRIEGINLEVYDEVLMDKILKIINDNIANPQLNVEMLSTGIGMSRVHMHHKLKELTSQSARDFIRTIRMKQASQLLSSHKHTVEQVCRAVGFVSISHFSVSFKEFYGLSPKEYMDKYE